MATAPLLPGPRALQFRLLKCLEPKPDLLVSPLPPSSISHYFFPVLGKAWSGLLALWSPPVLHIFRTGVIYNGNLMMMTFGILLIAFERKFKPQPSHPQRALARIFPLSQRKHRRAGSCLQASTRPRLTFIRALHCVPAPPPAHALPEGGALRSLPPQRQAQCLVREQMLKRFWNE